MCSYFPGAHNMCELIRYLCVCVCVCVYMHTYIWFTYSFNKCILSANHMLVAVLSSGGQGTYATVPNLNTKHPCGTCVIQKQNK